MALSSNSFGAAALRRICRPNSRLFLWFRQEVHHQSPLPQRTRPASIASCIMPGWRAQKRATMAKRQFSA